MKLKHYILGLIIVIIDQLSKYLIIEKNIIVVPSILEFNYTKNMSGAFGIGGKYVILVLSILIIIGIIIYLIKNKLKEMNYIPFVLVISGSIGNLIDRVFRGYVIDYIDVNLFNFPNFNIADISIVIGILFILIEILFNKDKA